MHNDLMRRLRLYLPVESNNKVLLLLHQQRERRPRSDILLQTIGFHPDRKLLPHYLGRDVACESEHRDDARLRVASGENALR